MLERRVRGVRLENLPAISIVNSVPNRTSVWFDRFLKLLRTRSKAKVCNIGSVGIYYYYYYYSNYYYNDNNNSNNNRGSDSNNSNKSNNNNKNNNNNNNNK